MNHIETSCLVNRHHHSPRPRHPHRQWCRQTIRQVCRDRTVRQVSALGHQAAAVWRPSVQRRVALRISLSTPASRRQNRTLTSTRTSSSGRSALTQRCRSSWRSARFIPSWSHFPKTAPCISGSGRPSSPISLAWTTASSSFIPRRSSLTSSTRKSSDFRRLRWEHLSGQRLERFDTAQHTFHKILVFFCLLSISIGLNENSFVHLFSYCLVGYVHLSIKAVVKLHKIFLFYFRNLLRLSL